LLLSSRNKNNKLYFDCRKLSAYENLTIFESNHFAKYLFFSGDICIVVVYHGLLEVVHVLVKVPS